jgi:hypothetical protein
MLPVMAFVIRLPGRSRTGLLFDQVEKGLVQLVDVMNGPVAGA